MNLGNITSEAFFQINDLDKTFIGTNNYMGIAFYWNYEYRHFLRDATIKQRAKVHAKFLENNLDIVGQSDKHLAIIKAVIKK